MSFKSGLRSLMSAVAATTFGIFGKKFNDNRSKVVEEVVTTTPRLTVAERYRNLILRRGAKEFTFDGITVVALNERNAIRKVNNIKNAQGSRQEAL